MSPLQIRMLLHYYWSPEDYQCVEDAPHAASMAVAESMEFFLRSGLLKCRFGDQNWAIHAAPFIDEWRGAKVEKPIFSITEKGNAMVAHLCAVQIPICQWVQPKLTAEQAEDLSRRAT